MKETIKACYSQEVDKTFIIRVSIDEISNITIEEVVGFYTGKPNKDNTIANIGLLRNEY